MPSQLKIPVVNKTPRPLSQRKSSKIGFIRSVFLVLNDVVDEKMKSRVLAPRSGVAW
jgi:hypothetical protein